MPTLILAIGRSGSLNPVIIADNDSSTKLKIEYSDCFVGHPKLRLDFRRSLASGLRAPFPNSGWYWSLHTRVSFVFVSLFSPILDGTTEKTVAVGV